MPVWFDKDLCTEFNNKVDLLKITIINVKIDKLDLIISQRFSSTAQRMFIRPLRGN